MYNVDMDQIKIGKFIAEERKKKELTQQQLAAALFVSAKTVSKWERGKGLPETSLMLPLCEELEITVNELLLGERLAEKAYKQAAEKNLVSLINENKKKYKLFVGFAMLTVLSVVCLILLASLLETFAWVRIALIAFAALVAILGLATAAALELEAGYYQCPKCKNLFKPTMTQYVKGAHTLTRRKLQCPLCGAKKYCKYVFAAKVGDEIKTLNNAKNQNEE